MSPSCWATAARKLPYLQSPAHQYAIDIIESTLIGQQTPHDAAKAIATYYKAPIMSSNRDGVYPLWSGFCEAIRHLGASIEHTNTLVDMIIAIHDLPDLMNTSGRIIEAPGGWKYWKDLPEWQLMFGDHGIEIDGPDDNAPEPWSWQEEAGPLLSASTFAATILTRASFPTGMEVHAVTAMWAALENEQFIPGFEAHQKAELYLPSAATWILVAGQKLREASLKHTGFNPGYPPNLTPHRWNKWIQRFESIAVNEDYTDNGRQSAADAGARMEPIGNE